MMQNSALSHGLQCNLGLQLFSVLQLSMPFKLHITINSNSVGYSQIRWLIEYETLPKAGYK